MISTVIIILIIVLFVIIGVRRGAACTLLNFAAMVAASVVSRFLSSVAAQAAYNAFFKANVINSLEETIRTQGEEYAVQNSLDALPGGLQGLLRFFAGLFGVSPEAMQARMTLTDSTTEQIARTIEQPVGELAVFLLSVVLSVVFFLLLWVVFKLIIRSVMPLFELPGIRTINRVIGGAVGALEGAVLVCFLVNVLYLLMSCLNPGLAENTTLFGGLFDLLVIFK